MRDAGLISASRVTRTAWRVYGLKVLRSRPGCPGISFLHSRATKKRVVRKTRCGGSVVAGGPLFTVENRGLSLFCQFGYFGPVEAFAPVEKDGRTFDLPKEAALVSIENGLHRTIGFTLIRRFPQEATVGSKPFD